jgi:hypothetical protein
MEKILEKTLSGRFNLILICKFRRSGLGAYDRLCNFIAEGSKKRYLEAPKH